MLKIIQKQLDLSLVRIALIFALVYFVLFNSAVVLYKFDYYKASLLSAILELSKESIYIYFSLFLFFFGLTIHRFLFIIVAPLLFLSGALASYYLYFFKIVPNKEMIEAFFGTEPNEVYELISIRLIVWLIFSLFVCVYSIKHFNINNTQLFFTKILTAVCLLITINIVIAPPYKALESYFPIQYLHNTYLHISEYFIHSTKLDISKEFDFVDNSENDLIAVLVIGESARYDHFGINGYFRETTPRISKLENLFSYQAESCSNVTYMSVPCLLSRISSNNQQQILKETSMLSVFTKLGFKTTWIGAQSLRKYFKNEHLGTLYDEVNFAIIPGGSALYQMNDHDEVMLPYISDLLRDNSNRRQLIAIHTSGSHWNYAARYTEAFDHFKPGCKAAMKADPSTCHLEGLKNIYDNSILYTDFFLSSVIDLLKTSNAILIYVSDHAESLGENGRFGHGGDITKEQSNIPLIVWMSDRFIAKHQDSLVAMKSHLNHEISHDYIFHSMLDCSGISSIIIDKNYSLCRKRNG